MKKRLPLICSLLLLCFFLTACGSSQLIGRWVEEDGNDILIFRKDGTGSADGFRFDWYISNGRLHIILFEDEEMAFSVRGNKLSLQDVYSDGSLSRNVDVYIRQEGSSIPIGTIVLCVIIAALLIIAIRFGFFDKLLDHLPVDNELVEDTTIAMGSNEGVSEKEPDAVTKVKDKVPDAIAQVKEKIPEAVSKIKEKAPEAIDKMKVKVPETVAQIKGKVSSAPLYNKANSNKVCSNCHHVIPSDAVFCPECGNEVMEKNEGICPRCGADLPDEGFFCPGCGLKVREITEPANEMPESHELSPESTTTKLPPFEAAPQSSEVKSSKSKSLENTEMNEQILDRTDNVRELDHSTGVNTKESSSKLKVSSNISQQRKNTGIKRSDSFSRDVREVDYSQNKKDITNLGDMKEVPNARDNSEKEPTPGMKICPKCKKEVRRGAAVCKHCGYDFIP